MTSAILLSGGVGQRMRSPTPKQYLSLQDKPVILWALEYLLTFPNWAQFVVVCEPGYQSLFTKYQDRIPLVFALPGSSRQESVLSGYRALSPNTELVCIHDGARPFIDPLDLRSVIEASKIHGAATLASPVIHTIKESDETLHIKKTLDRANLWDIHTPQVLAYQLLQDGLSYAQKHRITCTDDMGLAELLGHPAKLIPTQKYNIKITNPQDLFLASAYISWLNTNSP